MDEQPTQGPPEAEQPLAPVPQDAGPVDYTPDELAYLREQEVAFSWQASEYVHHEKDARWYIILASAVVILSLVMVFLQSWVNLVLIFAAAAAVVVYARKPPKILTYELTNSGLTIDGRAYDYQTFRSFGVLPDESWHTIDLEPVKRLSLRVSILFDEEDYDSIVGHLQLHLPRVDRQPGVVEVLSRYLRF